MAALWDELAACVAVCAVCGFLETPLAGGAKDRSRILRLECFVWPCPTCGGFICNQGHAKCGNPKCGGSPKQQERYLRSIAYNLLSPPLRRHTG